jgi:hypothetical protein
LWYVKGQNQNEGILDTVKATDPEGADTRFHRWGQSVGGFIELVDRFSVKGDLICDPFCGGGTTGIACLASSRQFIGIDCDAAAIAQAEKWFSEFARLSDRYSVDQEVSRGPAQQGFSPQADDCDGLEYN